jgi:hypothetical protein
MISPEQPQNTKGVAGGVVDYGSSEEDNMYYDSEEAEEEEEEYDYGEEKYTNGLQAKP